tara:strand:+ start:450 stop:728 length:279 start_codon:yes stop_codon:yes gene_type:complete
MNDQVWIQLLTGPVGALVLSLMALFIVGRWIGQHLPTWVNRHLDQFDKVIQEHSFDREIYKKSIFDVTIEIKDVGKEVKSIKEDVIEIKSKL